jgi:dolichyl-phosphate mannosyltransferase polypeptide 3
MSRATRFLATATVLGALWLALLFHALLFPDWKLPQVADQLIAVVYSLKELKIEPISTLSKAPSWILMTFGSVSLGNIGFSLLTFGDCPEAKEELLKDIQTARADLTRAGVLS